MKKIIALISALTIVASCFWGCNKEQKENQNKTPESSTPALAEPVEENSASDFAYKINDDEVTIIGYKGSSTTVNIPKEIEGKKVTVIGEKAFDGYEDPVDDTSFFKPNNINSITDIHIPSSVKRLETGAFTNCYSLKSVTLNEGLEFIGEGAFACCDQLTSIKIPDSVKTIESFAFYECYMLHEMYIGNSVETIGDYAAYNCYQLHDLQIPNSVKSLGKGCFAGCSNMAELNIPASVTSIPDFAFSQNYSLNKVEIADSVVSIGESAFSGCSAIESLTLPSKLEKISKYAFYSCTSLSKLEIPKSVSEIGEFAIGYTYSSDGSSEPTKIENVMISGTRDSAAHKYAKENNIGFVE